MHHIKNDQLEASINPHGAELSGLKHHGKETLWQGDERYWSGRAPILFPIVGALKDGCLQLGDKRYSMPRHGLARRSQFTCVEQSDDSITFALTANTETLQSYPWNFELQVTFALSKNTLNVEYQVFNHDSDDMLFTIGSHPAFALTLDTPSDLEDYAVHVQQTESLTRHRLNDDGLLNSTAETFSAADNVIPLSQTLFDDDALVFRDVRAKEVSLLRNGATLLTVATGQAPHLGIWSKPGAAFVCIEPWLGTSDFEDSDGQFSNKSDLQSLPPGESFNHSIAVTFPD